MDQNRVSPMMEKKLTESIEMSREIQDKKTVNDKVNGDRLTKENLGDGMYIEENGGCFSQWVEKVESLVYGFISRYSGRIKTGLYFTLLIAYFVYFIFSMQHSFGDEGSIVLLVITCALVWKLLFLFLDYKGIDIDWPKGATNFFASETGRRMRKSVRWLLYLIMSASVLVYLGVDVFSSNVRNTQSLGGMLVLIFFCFVISAKPSKVNWHPVFWAFIIQILVATLTLRTKAGYELFRWLGDNIQRLFGFSDAGSSFVIGKDFKDMGLAFSASGMVIFTNALVFLLNHWGVIEFIVLKLGRFLAFCLETGPVESVVAAANIFLGMTEAPLLVRPYLKTVTKSELHTIMTCGFASISGGIMAIFISVGAPPNHLLTAAVISAPAALAFSKLIYPETEKVSFQTQGNIRMRDDQAVKETNSLNAFSEGAVLALSICGAAWCNMLAFVSILDLLDALINWFGQRAGVDGLSFEEICSYLLFPLAYAMGVHTEDCKKVASLLGVKFFATPIISYKKLGEMIKNRKQFEDYISVPNNTWHWEGSDIFLETSNMTLVNGIMSERSEVISTYAMCGFSALTAIGISLGSLIPICPARKSDITGLVLRAFIAGNMASFATGAVSGALFSPGV